MSSYQSITCLLRTGMTYEYEYIVTYHVPVTKCFLLLLCAFFYLTLMILCTCCCCSHDTSNWYQGTRHQGYITLRAVGSTKKSKEIAPKKVGLYQHLVPGQPPPRKCWFAALLECVPGICCCCCCCCCCAHLFIWR